MMLSLMHLCLYFASTFADEKQRPPNVLFIVADDLGKYYILLREPRHRYRIAMSPSLADPLLGLNGSGQNKKVQDRQQPICLHFFSA